MEREIFSTIILIFIVLISGCIVPGTDIDIPDFGLFGKQPVKEFRHDVIGITSILVTPSRYIKGGETINLRVFLKNFQKPEFSPKNDISVKIFNDCQLFEDKKLVYCPGNKNEDVCEIDNFYPQSEKSVVWEMKAKDINVETSCDIGISVEYKHNSHTTTQVVYLNKEEYERLVLQGRGSEKKGIMFVGEGPIKAYLEFPDQPIIVSEENKGRSIAYFWIENKGTGIVSGNKVEIKHININSKNIESEDNKEIKECFFKDLESIEFVGKKTPKFACKVKLKNGVEIASESIFTIDVDINEYKYTFVKTINVVVQPGWGTE